MKSACTLSAVPPLLLTILSLVAVNPALAKGPRPSTGVTCTLSASPSTIAAGSSTTLNFSSKNATGGKIEPGSLTVGTSGTVVVRPAATVVYKGTFTGAGGTATCSTKVTVTLPEVLFTAYTTAYSYWDNTPPGSTAISHPILHRGAGGTGTYADPITLAVGHSIIDGKDILDFPAGTRFYIPNVRRYFIVEDTCGDGALPQNGPCHTGYPDPETTKAWLDMWIDGRYETEPLLVDNCASLLTGAHLVIQNPVASYLVVPGPLFQEGKCTEQFGDVAMPAGTSP